MSRYRVTIVKEEGKHLGMVPVKDKDGKSTGEFHDTRGDLIMYRQTFEVERAHEAYGTSRTQEDVEGRWLKSIIGLLNGFQKDETDSMEGLKAFIANALSALSTERKNDNQKFKDELFKFTQWLELRFFPKAEKGMKSCTKKSSKP